MQGKRSVVDGLYISCDFSRSSCAFLVSRSGAPSGGWRSVVGELGSWRAGVSVWLLNGANAERKIIWKATQ
jgi:hypothetical protein